MIALRQDTKQCAVRNFRCIVVRLRDPHYCYNNLKSRLSFKCRLQGAPKSAPNRAVYPNLSVPHLSLDKAHHAHHFDRAKIIQVLKLIHVPFECRLMHTLGPGRVVSPTALAAEFLLEAEQRFKGPVARCYALRVISQPPCPARCEAITARWHIELANAVPMIGADHPPALAAEIGAGMG